MAQRDLTGRKKKIGAAEVLSRKQCDVSQTPGIQTDPSGALGPHEESLSSARNGALSTCNCAPPNDSSRHAECGTKDGSSTQPVTMSSHFFESLGELESHERDTAAAAMLSAFGRFARGKNWNAAHVFLIIQNAMNASFIPIHLGERFLDEYLESYCSRGFAEPKQEECVDPGPIEPAKAEASNSNAPPVRQNEEEPMLTTGNLRDPRQPPAELSTPVKGDLGDASMKKRPFKGAETGAKDSRGSSSPQVISLLDDIETPVGGLDDSQHCGRAHSAPKPLLASVSVTPLRRRLTRYTPENPKRVKVEENLNPGEIHLRSATLRCAMCTTIQPSDYTQALVNKVDTIWKCTGKYRHIVCSRGNPTNSHHLKRHGILEFLGHLALQSGFKQIRPGEDPDMDETNQVMTNIAKNWEFLRTTWTSSVQQGECPKCVYVSRGGVATDYFKWVRWLAECYSGIMAAMGRDAVAELEEAWRDYLKAVKGGGLRRGTGPRCVAGESTQVMKSESIQKEPLGTSCSHGGNASDIKPNLENSIPPPKLVSDPFGHPSRKKAKVGDPVACLVCKQKPTTKEECSSYLEFIACEPERIEGHAMHRVCTFDSHGRLKPCLVRILSLWALFQRTSDLGKVDMQNVVLPKLRLTEERLYRMSDDSIAMELFSNQCPKCTWTCAGFRDLFLDCCLDILGTRLKTTSMFVPQ